MNSFIRSLQYRIPDLKIIKHNKGFAVNWPEGYQEGIRCIFTRKYINIEYREYHPRKNAKVALDRLVYFLKSYQPLIILPNEILTLIIDYLIGDIKSLSALGCCSKLLNKLTNQKKAYYKEKLEKIGLPTEWRNIKNLTLADYQVLLEKPKIVPRIYPFKKLHEKDAFFDHTDKIMKWKGKNPYPHDCHYLKGREYEYHYKNIIGYSKYFRFNHLPDDDSDTECSKLYIKDGKLVAWSSKDEPNQLYCLYIHVYNNYGYSTSDYEEVEYYEKLAVWLRKLHSSVHAFYFSFRENPSKHILIVTGNIILIKCRKIYPIPVSQNFNETYQSWLKEKKIKLDQISQVIKDFSKKLNTNSDLYSDRNQQKNINKSLNDFYYSIHCCLR